jgi:hypothetical protein
MGRSFREAAKPVETYPESVASRDCFLYVEHIPIANS